MKITGSAPTGWKTLWEKEKLLVTSNFSFSHGVFKRLVLQTGKNKGLFGKGVKDERKRNITFGKISIPLMWAEKKAKVIGITEYEYFSIR